MDQATMDRLIEQTQRAHDAGITPDQINARRDEINRLGESDPSFTEVDFNAAMVDLLRETTNV